MEERYESDILLTKMSNRLYTSADWNKKTFDCFDITKEKVISLPSESGLSFVSRILSKPNKINEILFAYPTRKIPAVSSNSRFTNAFLSNTCNPISASHLEVRADIELVLQKDTIRNIENVTPWAITSTQLQAMLQNPKLVTLTFAYKTDIDFVGKNWELTKLVSNTLISFLPSSTLTTLTITNPSLEVLNAIMSSNITSLKVIVQKEYPDAIEFCTKVETSKITNLSVLSTTGIGSWTLDLPFSKLTRLQLGSTETNHRQGKIDGLFPRIFSAESRVKSLSLIGLPEQNFIDDLTKSLLNSHSNVRILIINGYLLDPNTFGNPTCRIQRVFCREEYKQRIGAEMFKRRYVESILILLSSREIERIGSRASIKKLPRELHCLVFEMVKFK